MTGEHAHVQVLAPTHIVIAAADSPGRDACAAEYQCDGVADEEQFNLANERIEPGGKIEVVGGTYQTRSSIRLDKDRVCLEGHGYATCIVPQVDFAPGKFALCLFRDETKPVAFATLRGFSIRGNEIAYGDAVSGIEWCSYRGRMADVWVSGLTGTGLWVHNVVGSDGSGWNGYETVFSGLNIIGCKVGVEANSTDQHWVNCQIATSVQCNVRGSFTGTMLTACHFFGGAQNWAKTQTVVNMELRSCSRMSVSNSKIEHAARELVVMLADPSGGHIRWDSCGLRGGSSEMAGLYAQVRIAKVGNAVWSAFFDGCRFDADNSQPSWNIQIEADALRNGRIEGCMFANALVGDVTPFDAHVGKRSLINGLGWNQTNPNLGGDWQGVGRRGLAVEAADSGVIWLAKDAATWVALS